MPQTLLVTGATGSAGSNVCRLARQAGYVVRALVRPGTDTSPLKSMGAEPVVGDVTDPASMVAAAQGATGIIHCAARIGGTWSTATADDFLSVNLWGSINVLDAAERCRVDRVVMLLSGIILDPSETKTEKSRIVAISPSDSPYTTAKRAAYYEGMARAARGREVTFVVPAGIYGPTPYIDRALVPTIFTGTLLMAARGELKRYLPMPIAWVTAGDVAAVSLRALERGRRGRKYLAMGRPEDVCSLPEFCNRFLELAGLENRVAEVDGPATVDPEFGSMVKLIQPSYPEPYHDCRATTEELGVEPTSLSEGLASTLRWLRTNGRMPASD